MPTRLITLSVRSEIIAKWREKKTTPPISTHYYVYGIMLFILVSCQQHTHKAHTCIFMMIMMGSASSHVFVLEEEVVKKNNTKTQRWTTNPLIVLVQMFQRTNMGAKEKKGKWPVLSLLLQMDKRFDSNNFLV